MMSTKNLFKKFITRFSAMFKNDPSLQAVHFAEVSPKQAAQIVLHVLHCLVKGFGQVPIGQAAWQVLSVLR